MLSAPKMSLDIKFHFLVSQFSFLLAILGYKPNDFFLFHLSDMNMRSSRSDLILCFLLKLQQAYGKLYLVDLAGSEKVGIKNNHQESTPLH